MWRKSTVAVLLVLGTAGEGLAQRVSGKALSQLLERLAPEAVAILLAENGLSAGMVLHLPETLESELDQARTQDNPPRRHPAFEVLMANTKPSSPGIELWANAAAQEVLESYADVRAWPGWIASPERTGRVSVLRTPSAGACESALAKRVHSPHSGAFAARIVADVVADAKGTSPPPGMIGSCLGGYRPQDLPARTSGKQSLEDALNEIAAQFHGVVWVAVQTARSECSLGLILKGEGSASSCRASITADLGK